jgi:hypothetical protein
VRTEQRGRGQAVGWWGKESQTEPARVWYSSIKHSATSSIPRVPPSIPCCGELNLWRPPPPTKSTGHPAGLSRLPSPVSCLPSLLILSAFSRTRICRFSVAIQVLNGLHDNGRQRPADGAEGRPSLISPTIDNLGRRFPARYPVPLIQRDPGPIRSPPQVQHATRALFDLE